MLYEAIEDCFNHKLLKQHETIKIDPTNEEMTISQVIKFFVKYDLQFTKTMIQNYIRIGLLPGPVQKRYYTENHLMLLFLIYHLKEGFSLEEIKKVFAPILKDESTFEDDLITPKQLYNIYGEMQKHVAAAFCGEEPFALSEMVQRFLQSTTQNEQEVVISEFMLVLYTMVQTITAKKISQVLIDNILV
ncbi:MAG: DUF1836 domain-containing protein [Cellulosilyticaceae bacterium]